MAVHSVWESLSAQGGGGGRRITEAIWRHAQFDGYLAHELIEDLDDPGHLLVVSQWTTRGRADEVLHDYASHRNARRANELVSRPRTRTRPRRVWWGMTPDTLLALASDAVPQPDRGPTIYPDPLASPATAAQALSLPRLDTSRLAALRIYKTVVQLVDGL